MAHQQKQAAQFNAYAAGLLKSYSKLLSKTQSTTVNLELKHQTKCLTNSRKKTKDKQLCLDGYLG